MHIINRDSDSSSKLLWVLLIMAFPIFGGLVYLLIGNRKIPKALMIKDRQAYSDYKKYALQNIEILSDLHEDDYVLDKMTSMAWSNGYFPVYETVKLPTFLQEKINISLLLKNLLKLKILFLWNSLLSIKASCGILFFRY